MDAGQRLQAQEDRLQAPKAHFYAKTLQMKIILSRKGFDSGSGGVPSPIFPDGLMMSLPIPDRLSGIAYKDVAGNRWLSMGEAVSQLGAIPETHRAHLDPDLVAKSLPRKKDWRPIFGQVDAAEGHLRRQGVGIPLVGGLIGAALDYVIATAMTWRVGTMVSIYYQNGGKWVGSRKHTFELAKGITGGIEFGLSDLVSKFSGSSRPTMDINLNEISAKIPEVFNSQVRNLRPVVKMMMQMGGAEKVRQLLKAQGIPEPVIDAALKFAASAAGMH